MLVLALCGFVALGAAGLLIFILVRPRQWSQWVELENGFLERKAFLPGFLADWLRTHEKGSTMKVSLSLLTVAAAVCALRILWLQNPVTSAILESRLEVFAGYLELGMFTDANEELENLPTDWKVHPQVLHARLCLLVEMKKWEEGIILGQSLLKLWPKEAEFWLKTAYCQHELRLTGEARETLLAAPAAVRKVTVYSYNMACYEAQLGNIKESKRSSKPALSRTNASAQTPWMIPTCSRSGIRSAIFSQLKR